MDIQKKIQTSAKRFTITNDLHSSITKINLFEVESQMLININNCLLNANLKLYISFLLRVASQRPATFERSKQLTQRFLYLVEEFYLEQESPEFYATSLNIDVSTLRKICQKELLQPPLYWINFRKIIDSLVLLYKSEKQIKEIAYEAGVKDASYFVRMFKKYTGITPTSYRAFIIIVHQSFLNYKMGQ